MEINVSIDVDKRLAMEDIAGSRAHADMLAEMGIITQEDNAAIQSGLDSIRAEIRAGEFVFDRSKEDIHMNIEARLTELVGEPGRKLHTARSRNDQVATDFRLWMRGALAESEADIAALQSVLVTLAANHTDTIMPGYTHLQTAQPIVFGHHLLAYVEMLDRDKGRLADARVRLNESPLGAAAMAGTGFPIDRETTSEALGFSRPMANSMDAVSARDFALEALSALSISAIHLSRFAEEIIFWSSAHFGFIRLSEAWTTGSSIMPQKRNPDAAELVRGKASQMVAQFASLAGIVKALPLTYAKDLQDDKAICFDAFDTFALSLEAMRGMVSTLTVNKDAMQNAAGWGYSTATDFADILVRDYGFSFREAHKVTRELVFLADKKGLALSDVSEGDLKSIDARLEPAILPQLTLENAIHSRNSYGGTAPKRVAEQVESWRHRLVGVTT